MAAVTAADARQSAREQLLRSLHDAGIEPDSPLGVLFMRQCDATANACDQMSHATAAADELLRQSREELAKLRADLVEGREQVKQMGQVAQSNIRKQELFREREVQMALEGLVSGLLAGLKERVFNALREEIPTNERRFYKEARWGAYVRMMLAGTVLVVIGFGTGLTWDWHAARTGRFCENNYRRDPGTGMKWCALELPAGQAQPER